VHRPVATGADQDAAKPEVVKAGRGRLSLSFSLRSTVSQTVWSISASCFDDPKLWRVQVEAITKLEKSLAQNRPRSLVQMATGSGKTFTAISAIYRLIKFAGAKRVLFLVDRTNLGRKTYREFQGYASPYTGRKFTEEYNVQHLTRNTLDPVSRVCIATVQRVYSMLRGDPDDTQVDVDQSMYETAASLVKEPVPVSYNPAVPIEAFDFIVCDECHRSIYNLWRQVLDYFDAYLVGLTATPTKQTIGFFNNNLVMEYGHQQAVADGVNVGFDVYRIRTKITDQGATVEAEPGLFGGTGSGDRSRSGPGRRTTKWSPPSTGRRPTNSTQRTWTTTADR
jgi:type I restriction enzyme R subunit